MTSHDLQKLLEEARKDIAVFERLRQALALFASDIRFARYSHDSFLPAAKDYRDFLKAGGEPTSASPEFRHLRARLGGASRHFYRHQRPTFEGMIRVVVPSHFAGALTPQVLDSLWQRFKNAERSWLSRSRPVKRETI
jgi:hypothetical protein